MNDKDISQAVISRLPRYYRYLGELKEQGIERISSRELSELMHVTASQIRQDLNHFGGFGQQGYGYNVPYLQEEIGNLLGCHQKHDMILVGAGKLGQAIVGYINGKDMPFVFRGAFDIDPAVIGKTIGNTRIYPMEDLKKFVKAHNIDMAALTVPRTEAVKTAELLTECRIKGIWNFAHIDLHVPSDIKVENVHMLDSLMKLSYNLQSMETETGK